MAENKSLSDLLSSDLLSSVGLDEEANPKKAWSMSEINNLLGEDDDEFADDPYEFAREYEVDDELDQIDLSNIPEPEEIQEEIPEEIPDETPEDVQEDIPEEPVDIYSNSSDVPSDESDEDGSQAEEESYDDESDEEEPAYDDAEDGSYYEEQAEVRAGFRDRFKSLKERFVNVLEGGEEEGEFSEQDVTDETPELSEEAQKSANFFRRRQASKGRRGAAEPKAQEKEHAGMIMELADDDQEGANKKALADKTIGLRPTYNENIEHQILASRAEVIQTPDADNGPNILDGSADFELAKTRKIDRTSELSEVPQIIAADASLNTFDRTIVAKGDGKVIEHEQNQEIDGQIKLEGFDDEEPPEQVDEELTEEQLRIKRTQMVKNFKLGATHEGEPVEELDDENDEHGFNEDIRRAVGDSRFVRHEPDVSDYLKDEYENREEDAERIEDSLLRLKKSSFVKTIITAVIFAVSLILSVYLTASQNNLEVFGSALIAIAVNAGLVVVAALFNIKTIVKGIRGIFLGRLNAASATSIVVIAALLQDLIVGLVSAKSGTAVGLYTAAATFALLQSALAKHLAYRRALSNFTFFISGIQLYSTEVVTDEEDAASISRGILIENPVIAYNAKIDDVPYFVEDTFSDDPADYNAERSTLIILIAALVLGVAFAIAKGPVTGAALFVAAICMAVPAFATLASGMSLYIDDTRLSKKGSAIVGHKAVEQSAFVNAYAVDSTDLFVKGSCQIKGIKTFHNMRIDDAILYAAALVIESEGPLAHEFENVILGKADLLPSIEGLSYEERLGLSAWIGERRILFGNRSLMQAHSVDLPDEEFESQYTVNGRKAMYLAISGKVAAMFVIAYRPSKRIRRAVRNLDRAGVTILVRNTDCNITEELISKYYRIPVTAVKVLGPVAGEKVMEYKARSKTHSTSGIIHNGTVQTSFKTFFEARRLYDGVSINNVLSIAFVIIAAIVAIIVAVTSEGLVADYVVVIYQLVAAVIAVGLPALRSHNVK